MDRIASASISELLDRLAPAIEAGVVNVISVEAIRDGSGARWPRKREQVQTFLMRAFERTAGAADVFVALNDTEFLIVQPELSRAAALSRSSNLLKEALVFFLGAMAPADLKLLQVTGYAGGSLSVEAVDARRLAQAEADDGHEVASFAPAATPPADPLSAGAPRRATLAPLHPQAEVVTRAEPVWNIGQRAVVSYILDVQVVDGDGPARRPFGLGELPPRLAADVAVELVAAAGEALAESAAAPVALHVPLPLQALSYSTSRYRLLHELKAVTPDIRRRLIVEIAGLTDGFPQARLAELVTSLAPYCRAVLARAPSETANPRPWRQSGLGGVSIDCAHLRPDDRSAPARMATFAKLASEVAPACLAYGLASRSLLLAAWSAGFTHLSGQAVSNGVAGLAGAVRLQPKDLYAAELSAADLAADVAPMAAGSWGSVR